MTDHGERSFFIAVVLALLVRAEATTSTPIIGIFAQPKSSSYCPNGKSCEYIAASYVEFVESHGARAVPISYYSSDAEIDAHFASLNGVLMPGGGSGLPASARRMYNNAVAANQANLKVPFIRVVFQM